MTWREFLKAHWEMLASTDFFAVEVWTGRGLMRYHVLFMIQLATRAVEIAGVVPEPTESWMLQIARNLVDPWTGFLTSSRLLIHDRATVISEHFCQLLRSGQVEPLWLPVRSPNLNAFAEPVVRTIRQECLGRMFFSERVHCVVQWMNLRPTTIRNEITRVWQINSSAPKQPCSRQKATFAVENAPEGCSIIISAKPLNQ